MSDNLPPLPRPSSVNVGAPGWRDGSEESGNFTADQMRAYGQQCRAQALEEAALTCRHLRGFTRGQCDHFESAVLALKDKT